MNIIGHLEKIILLSKGKGLTDIFFESAKEHLDASALILHTSPIQTTIFALLLEHFGEYSVSFEDLVQTFKCGNIQLLRYFDDFDEPKYKKLIRETTSSNDHFKDSVVSYTIPLENCTISSIHFKTL